MISSLKSELQRACVGELDGHVRDRMLLPTDVERAAASPQGGVAGNEEARCLHAAATRAAHPPLQNAGGGRFEPAQLPPHLLSEQGAGADCGTRSKG
jgi:hypothetical protein